MWLVVMLLVEYYGFNRVAFLKVRIRVFGTSARCDSTCTSVRNTQLRGHGKQTSGCQGLGRGTGCDYTGSSCYRGG